MRGAFLFIGGMAAGAAMTLVGFMGYTSFRVFDEGISQTYRCNELDVQAGERDMLHRLTEVAYIGMAAEDLERKLIANNLFGFRKAQEAIVAQEPNKLMNISFETSGDKVDAITISGIDGRCAPPQGGN